MADLVQEGTEFVGVYRLDEVVDEPCIAGAVAVPPVAQPRHGNEQCRPRAAFLPQSPGKLAALFIARDE